MTDQALTLAIIFLSPFLGGYSAYFCLNWPKQQNFLWRKEAHEILNLEFKPSSYSGAFWNTDCCKHRLHIQHRLPIIAYFFNRGRCPFCKKSLNKLYLCLEVTHLMFAVLLCLVTPDVTSLLLNFFIISALLTLSQIDFTLGLIPDECCLAILISALILRLYNDSLSNHVLAMIIAFVSLLTLRYIFSMIKKQEVMGLGDVKLYSVLGAWLGLNALTGVILGASLLGILYTLVMLIANPRISRSSQIAFGPFLAISGIIAFFYYAT
ncbi:prepilin peptidase [Marinomonas sp.]